MSRVRVLTSIASAAIVAAAAVPSAASANPREHELGLPIGGTPGPLNAITDVAGVEVGHATIIAGSGKLEVGKGPVRTGVTVVFPRGRDNPDPVFGAWFTLNGNGEMTGTTWLQESGFLEGPIAITNTHSVGTVRDTIIQWEVTRKNVLQPWWLPVVAETYDGDLNDINGFHVKPRHVLAALDGARPGKVEEGAVGGGTGMVCFGFKGGIGTASRKLTVAEGGWTVGVLVQCNFGRRPNLRIAGAPVGEEITDLDPCIADPQAVQQEDGPPPCNAKLARAYVREELGSIIVTVATDAPLLPHQLKRIATRVSLGIGRQGGFASNGSGDIFVAFSTANPGAWAGTKVTPVRMLSNEQMTPLFKATAEATEAAITNALLAAPTTTGANDYRVHGLPADRLTAIMRKYGRMKPD